MFALELLIGATLVAQTLFARCVQLLEDVPYYGMVPVFCKENHRRLRRHELTDPSWLDVFRAT
jgi:hypothetical protein